MNKTKLIGLLLLLAMLIPTVSACHTPEPVVEEVEPAPFKAKLRTTIRNSHRMFVWDGRMWIFNPNVTVTEMDGRVYVIYH